MKPWSKSQLFALGVVLVIVAIGIYKFNAAMDRQAAENEVKKKIEEKYFGPEVDKYGYKRGWNNDTPSDIIATLISKSITGCSEFTYKIHATERGRYLVACNAHRYEINAETNRLYSTDVVVSDN